MLTAGAEQSTPKLAVIAAAATPAPEVALLLRVYVTPQARMSDGSVTLGVGARLSE